MTMMMTINPFSNNFTLIAQRRVLNFVHQIILVYVNVFRWFIKGWAPAKLTGCEQDLAINLPGCFSLLFLLSFIRKTKNAWLKTPTVLLHKNLIKPLVCMGGTGGLIFSVGSSPGWGSCVIFLGETLNSHSTSLYPGGYM